MLTLAALAYNISTTSTQREIQTMITTMTNLRKKVKVNVSDTGLILSKNNPYWANDEQIKAMECAIVIMKENGDDAPNRRYEITPHQMELLTNWIDSLKRTYLFNL